MTPRKIRRYGWRKDIPDPRDFKYMCPHHIRVSRPPVMDLRPSMPPVYDQGELGSCTGNGIAGALQYDKILQKASDADIVPSRLFIYYNERVIEGDPSVDGGAQIRDGAKAVSTQGFCGEDIWPYDISQFATLPPATCYDVASKHIASSYLSIFQSLDDILGCIAEGYPVVFGFTVFESFESGDVEQTGVMPMPGPSEAILGGHCVMAVGYSDASKYVICRNSWGDGWGEKGYFYMPYPYISSPDLASDFWTFRKVS